MSATSRRSAARERQAAELLGTKRVHRSRYQRAPDVEPVVLPSGEVLSCEVKTRKRLPALLRDALAQAKRYAPSTSAVPIAVISEFGGEPIACLSLRALRRLLGLEEVAVQLSMIVTKGQNHG